MFKSYSYHATAAWFIGGGLVTAVFSGSLFMLAKNAGLAEVLTVGMIVPCFTWVVQLAASYLLMPEEKRRLYWGDLGRICFWGSVALLPGGIYNLLTADPPLWISAANVLASVAIMAIDLFRRTRPHGISWRWPLFWCLTITCNMGIFVWSSSNWWQADMSGIQVGDQAPDVSLSTHAGEPLRLSSLVGQKVVVLFFYPKDGTSVCTKEACAFRDSFEQFTAAGAEVIGISADTADSHKAFAAEHRLPYLLASDEDGSLRKAFGVPKTMGLLPGRVTYVIDKQGIVRLVFNALLAADDHMAKALEEVERLARESA